MKKWNGGLVVTLECDAILCHRNSFYDDGKMEDADEECQTCPDGNRSNHLGSYRCDPNAATDNLEATSSPTVNSDTQIQSNPTKDSWSKPIQAQSGGGLGKNIKSFIILLGLTVPNIILYALQCEDV